MFAEIAKVRASLFQINGVKKEPLKLPEPDGTPVTLNEKVYVPVREHPDVSRISIYPIICLLKLILLIACLFEEFHSIFTNLPVA